MRRGFNGSGHPTPMVGGVPARVRALISTDLDSHVGFIRRELGAGKSCAEVGDAIGVTAARVYHYAKKMNIHIVPRRNRGGLSYGGKQGINQTSYRPTRTA